ncbi:hypothetical protein PIB30_031962 [Stylosanthes scabra]|uniref:Uncharacterized protein n=1 Tax=Stylosanthes scabra TaxID=79078 RepID=A0ABU6SCT3_9FABA|nr:hypothetical protein [Stylosanthes scabra]
MTSKSEELVQGNGGTSTVDPQPQQPQPESQPDGSPEDLLSKGSNSTKVFKSGPLFISSKDCRGVHGPFGPKTWPRPNEIRAIFYPVPKWPGFKETQLQSGPVVSEE